MNITRRQALILITHLAGDIVQPLHVGAAFVDKDGRFVVPKTIWPSVFASWKYRRCLTFGQPGNPRVAQTLSAPDVRPSCSWRWIPITSQTSMGL